jgi:hypothetical protein
MTAAWTWGDFFTSALGVLQWTIAILSVGATLALVTWILMMILRKDRAK